MPKSLNVLILVLSILQLNACQCVQTKKSPKRLVEPPKKELHHIAPTPTPTAAPKAVPYTEALAYAQKNLAHEGILIQKPDGYAYLKVDDRYINDLFPLLHAQPNYKKPPYFRRNNQPGAHISVIYKDENIKLKEVGQKFSFKIRDITTVNPKNNSYIILQVDSPELEKLRTSYGLGPKLHGHEFHISIAKKTE